MRPLKATLLVTCGLLLATPGMAGAGELSYEEAYPFEVQILTYMGRADEAVEMAKEMIDGLRPAENSAAQIRIGEILTFLCEAHTELGQHDLAIPACLEAVATLEDAAETDAMAEAQIHILTLPQLTRTYEQAGEYQSALNVCKKRLDRFDGRDPGDPDRINLLTQMGDLHTGMGQFREAETFYLTAIADGASVPYSDRTFQPDPRLNLSALYRLEERFAEAEGILKNALAELEITRTKLSDIPSARASVRAARISIPALSLSLAWSYFEQQRFDDARETAKDFLENLEKEDLADSVFATYARILLGRIEDARAPGSPEAEYHLASAAAAPLEEDSALSYFFHAIAQSELARHHLLNHKDLEAEVLAREAVETLTWSVGEDNHYTARAMIVLARVLQQKEKIDEALTHAQAAFAAQWGYLPPYHSEIGETLTLMAELYEALGDTRNLRATRDYLEDHRVARKQFESGN